MKPQKNTVMFVLCSIIISVWFICTLYINILT